MSVASFGSGRQQRSHPLPQVVRNKISTHSDTLPTKIVQHKTRSSTHSETISKTNKDGNRLQITATTDHGTISGTWPAKTLESAWSSDTRGDAGSLNKNEVTAAAAQFAHKWFPQNVAGSDPRVRSIGDGPTMAYTVVYRRYAEKVMMPMRLDLTVTTTGRVIGFAARTVDDPVLPRVTVDKAKAQALAKAATGLPSESALLLAQQVKGEWRPVWLVGSGKQDIAIDAATGERIAGKR
ncbi:hypothetical protein [Streptomyces rishiriensis]|uniref:hypothetical protein n=1 Tax=Streptomyces rishiriensis TaxID=68264 RepID=UPI00142D36BD|nr:hypothetical protein [Streptomyces rishiriensis]